MFRSRRIYSVASSENALTVWYFLTREGRKGPYGSEAIAKGALQEFIIERMRDPENRPRTRFIASHYY